MNTLALFPEKRDGAGDRDTWATPQALFDQLDRTLGPFTLDACAFPQNAKCKRFYTPTDDGLVQPWHEDAAGGVTWCNPPFNELERWTRKAWRESLRGGRSVVLLPANRTDQEWFHRYVVNVAAVSFLRGRTAFVPPPGVRASSPAFACLLALYGATATPAVGGV